MSSERHTRSLTHIHCIVESFVVVCGVSESFVVFLCEIASVPTRPGRPERASSLVPHVPTASRAFPRVPTRPQTVASDGVPSSSVPMRPQIYAWDGVRPSLKAWTPPRPSLPVRSGRGRRN